MKYPAALVYCGVKNQGCKWRQDVGSSEATPTGRPEKL